MSSKWHLAAHHHLAAAGAVAVLDAVDAVDDGRRSGSLVAGMISISSSIVASGLRNRCRQPSTTSLRLCGGMLVAMPTAIPPDPLTSKFGQLARQYPAALFRCRRNWGRNQPFPCRYRPAFRAQSWPIEFRCTAWRQRLSPVDRAEIALAVDHMWAHRKVPEPAARWCRTPTGRRAGWYLPITSPTMRADFLYGRFQSLLSSCIAEEHPAMHRLEPRRARPAGPAPTMTLMA